MIEDDALLEPEFVDRVESWIARFPMELLSLYLGTNGPDDFREHQVQRMMKDERDFLTLPALLHGVCYTLPTDELVSLRVRPGTPDTALGEAWYRQLGREIHYVKHSLVDHADGLSIATGRQYPFPRVARVLVSWAR